MVPGSDAMHDPQSVRWQCGMRANPQLSSAGAVLEFHLEDVVVEVSLQLLRTDSKRVTVHTQKR